MFCIPTPVPLLTRNSTRCWMNSAVQQTLRQPSVPHTSLPSARNTLSTNCLLFARLILEAFVFYVISAHHLTTRCCRCPRLFRLERKLSSCFQSSGGTSRAPSSHTFLGFPPPFSPSLPRRTSPPRSAAESSAAWASCSSLSRAPFPRT